MGRLEEIDAKIKETVSELKKLRPDAEIRESNKCYYLTYYTVTVVKGKVRIAKQERSIYFKSEAEKLAKYPYLTKEEAQNAIDKVMPKALEKFKQCLEAYRSMTQEMQFFIGYTYEGDSHGIYDEYKCINFKMDGFDFEFELID